MKRYGHDSIGEIECFLKNGKNLNIHNLLKQGELNVDNYSDIIPERRRRDEYRYRCRERADDI